jgi:tetrahydromethanopterin S-methyltransferase subunit F
MKKNNAYLITVTSEREGKKTFSLRVTKSAGIAVGTVFGLVVAALIVLLFVSAETARLHRMYGEERELNEKLTKENILLRQVAGIGAFGRQTAKACRNRRCKRGHTRTRWKNLCCGCGFRPAAG